jgi:VWFA-related protein
MLKKIRFYFLLLVCLGCLVHIFSASELSAENQEINHNPLQYNVQVSAQVIPIFAIDKKGNPVYDLREDEIELYVNKKPWKILQFTSYHNEATPGPVTTINKQNSTVKAKSPERVNFILIDGVFTGKKGKIKAVKIAGEIIKSGRPGDSFIIMVISPKKGFQYVVGPEKNRDILLTALKDVVLTQSYILLLEPVTVRALNSPGSPHAKEFLNMMFSLTYSEKKALAKQKRNEFLSFTNSFKQLKYALKSIPYPKTVYLVSDGLFYMAVSPRHRSGSSIIMYYESLRRAAANINRSGTIFYPVNTRPKFQRSNIMLKYMAKVSGGSCINGANVKELSKNIKSYTEAYYEVAFSTSGPKKVKDQYKIKIKCKRKGIKLNTLRFGEKTKTYAQMPKEQRKVFALNVVTGGSWSRMVGKVMRIKNRSNADMKQDTNAMKAVSMKIPDAYKGRKIDIFVVNVEPTTFRSEIELNQRFVGAQKDIEVNVKKRNNRKQYVVLVEPGMTDCRYMQII